MAKHVRKEKWTITHPNAAGIDVGAATHYVAVPPEQCQESVREFGCHTVDLQSLADWLQACKVDTVALESTGVYWIPLYEVLEARGLDVWLVNAKSVRNVSGRKSDVLDCQWLQQLHCFGLLQKAFRPDAMTCELRAIVRLRETVLEERSRHTQRMQKALTQMNVQLTNVISDIMGVTGQAIIRAIVAGERDPCKLARLRDYRIQANEEEIAKSLQGTWKNEHLFCLAHELITYDFHTAQIGKIDTQIELYLNALRVYDKAPGENSKNGRRKNSPLFDVRKALLNWSGVDLTAVPGIDVTTAMKVLSELGATLHRFPSAKHFCSWLGLCPGTQITGGKRITGATKRLPNRITRALKMAAYGLSRSHCAMGAYYRRLALRMGSAKAITAVAHKLARIIYVMLTKQADYVQEDITRHEQRYRDKAIKSMRRRAAEMGFDLVAKPEPAV